MEVVSIGGFLTFKVTSKYSRLELNKVTDEAGTATDNKTIMEKVKAFYQKLYKRRVLNIILL